MLVRVGWHTRRQGLLQLLGLVIVLQHQGVKVLLASDLELDVVGLLVLLDPRGCIQVSRHNSFFPSLILLSILVEDLSPPGRRGSRIAALNTYRKRPSDGRSR